MKKTFLFASILMVPFIAPIKSIAQQKATADTAEKESPVEKESYGLISANYSSDLIFLGRKSSLAAPYLSAFAGYYHKSGLFINGGASYLAAAGENRFDLFTLTTGYDYYLKNFSAGISGTKYFFNNKSYTVKSDLSGYVSGYADYDFGIVEVYINASTYFSNTPDFISGLALSHTFYAADGNLTIAPAFYMNAGTQNYYSSYSNNLRFRRNMVGGGGSSPMGTGMAGALSFNVLDYELGVPVSYTLNNKFGFSFYPVYAIPVSAATINNGTNTYKEVLSNSFFWSLGVSYKF